MNAASSNQISRLAQQLGHTDGAFTARTYARCIPDDAPAAGSKAEAAWAKGS